MEVIISLFGIRNKEGKWFRARGYQGYGESWVDDIKMAKFYTKKGTARSQVTYWSNAYPQFGIPDLMELQVNNIIVLDEVIRVEKSMKAKKVKQQEAELRWKQYKVEEAKKQLQEAIKIINENK